MEKKLWNAPEIFVLGVQNTEISKNWTGGVDATYEDPAGNYWESHSGTN